MYKIFFIIFFLSVSPSFAQQKLIVHLQRIPLNTKTEVFLVLAHYHQDNFQLIESKPIPKTDSTASLLFDIPANIGRGLFQLFLAEKGEKDINKAEFIWSPKENPVLDIRYFQLKNGDLAIEKSNENEAYSRLLQIKSEYLPLLQKAYDQRKFLPYFDAQYKKKSLEIELKTEQLQYNYDNILAQLAELFPETYTAQVLVPLSLVPVRSAREIWVNQYDSYLSFLNQYFFYHTDFNNPELLNHYAFSDKIFEYLNAYIDRSSEGFEAGIDLIMSKLQENEAVNSFVFNSLLKSFLKLDNEPLTKYLMEKHSADCSLNLPFEELKKLQTIQALSIGGLAPEISLPDNKGNYQSLRAYCQKNKYTVVYFWISWCARCQKETPKMLDIYKKYQGKGLGVYAVSLDEKKEDWEAALAKYAAPWVNVSELLPIPKSQVLPAYSISHTPAVFILNSKGEVLQKAVFGEELDAFLAEKLKGDF